MQSIRTKRKHNRLLTPRGRYYNIGGAISSAFKNPFGGVNGTQLAQAGIGAGIGAIGQLGGGLIGGGLESGAGSAISGIGGSIGGAISMVNPVLGGIVSGASGLIGGLTNKMFGSKMNKENIAKVEGQINAINSFQADASNFDSLVDSWNNAPTMAGFTNKYIGKDGWFSNKAKKKARALRAEMETALAFRDNSLANNAENLVAEQADSLLANYSAYGGHVNRFDDGGYTLQDGVTDAVSFLPLVGTAMDAYELYKEPSWENAGYLGLSIASEIPFLKWMRGARIAKRAAKATSKAVDAASSYTKAAEKAARMEAKGTLNPRAVNSAKGASGRAFFDNKVAQREAQQATRQLGEQRVLERATGYPLFFGDALANEHQIIMNRKAFGGELGTNGADFTNGIIQINSGGTHEQNPNEGVIFGMDQEGIPNLVEEGEVIFNDYVFSNRIKVPKTVRKRHRLTDGVTFADAAKELAKESEERPNDPISQNGLEYLMGDLMTEQEMIKAKREKNTFSKGGRVHKYADGTPDLGLLDRPIDMTDFSWMEELNKATNPTGKGRNTKASNRLFDIANMRYIPALGAAIGVTTDLLGITNKPDYEPANMVLEASKGMGAAPSVRFNPIGNYLTYNPFDRDYYINRLNASAGASRRAIGNSGGSAGQRMAAVLAGDNNYLNQLGSLARQAEEYNLAQRQQVETFNRATNQYNSEGALKADIANAENRLKTANLRMESTIAGAKMRQAAKDASDLARSTNLTNLFDSLGNIGWEEYQRNAIESNPALSGYYQSRTGNIGYNPRRAKGGFLTIKKKRK